MAVLQRVDFYLLFAAIAINLMFFTAFFLLLKKKVNNLVQNHKEKM